MSLFQYPNKSICQLYLQNCKYYFNEEECITLSHSPLGIQCQVLDILVKNHESIINLRVLHVHCEHKKNCEYLLLRMNDQVHHENIQCKDDGVQWLKDRLSSTCLISRHPDSISHIRIWI
jgi:hypothetical protein